VTGAPTAAAVSPPARIVVDLRANHDTGVHRYGMSLLGAALPLLVDDGWRPLVVVGGFQSDQAREVVARSGTAVPLLVDHEQTGFVRRSITVRRAVAAFRPHLYYSSHYTVDLAIRVPTVFTLHDLIRLQRPELGYTDESFRTRYGWAEWEQLGAELRRLPASRLPLPPGASRFLRYFAALNEEQLRRAAHVAVVSQSTVDSAVATFGAAIAPRLSLIPGGVDLDVFRPEERLVRAVRERYRILGRYLLFVGLAGPHKRLDWLVRQLAAARSTLPAGTRLVAVGGYAASAAAAGSQAAELDGVDASDLVIHTGRVDDATLAALYSGATALVSASVAEGGGLPAQEALACGCEVIVTDIPGFREHLGDAARYFGPGDATGFIELVRRALTGAAAPLAPAFRPHTWHESAKDLHRTLAETWQAVRGRQTVLSGRLRSRRP
jgi:glycosyltransferase involved in cell wall biosynthesis